MAEAEHEEPIVLTMAELSVGGAVVAEHPLVLEPGDTAERIGGLNIARGEYGLAPIDPTDSLDYVRRLAEPIAPPHWPADTRLRRTARKTLAFFGLHPVILAETSPFARPTSED